MSTEIVVAEVEKQAAKAVAWANGLTVTSKETADQAIAGITKIKALRKSWTEYWSGLKETAHKAWKEVVAKEKAGTDICDQAERIAKGKVLAWQQQELERAAAEQRRLQAEADERARKEREALEKKAAKLKTPEKAEALRAQAAAVQAPIVQVAVNTVDAATRTTWKGEVVDIAALLAAATPGSVAASFITINQQAVDAFARSTKGKVPVAGVLFKAVESLAMRGERGCIA
jgi:predicted component of type VI protein secretion system